MVVALMLLNNHLLREKGSKYNAVQKTRNSTVNNVGYVRRLHKTQQCLLTIMQNFLMNLTYYFFSKQLI